MCHTLCNRSHLGVTMAGRIHYIIQYYYYNNILLSIDYHIYIYIIFLIASVLPTLIFKILDQLENN